MSNQNNPENVAAAVGARAASGGGQSPKGKSGFSVKKFLHFLRTFPWTLLLIVTAACLELVPKQFQGTTIDYAMVVFALVVLVFELAKSTDIRKSRFLTDIVVAVIGIVVSTALLTYYIVETGKNPAFYHWVVVSVITIDAILSPTISFSTALRNMSVADM